MSDPITHSVIVPVYHQWDEAMLLLADLGRQSIDPRGLEIILVDNGEVPRPAFSVPSNVRVVHCGIPGAYAARNKGADIAAGRWLVFTDADCRPRSGWLAALATAATSDRVLLAGDIVMTPSTPRPGPAECYDLVKGIPQRHYVRKGYAATANLMVPRTVFDAVGGFDPARLSGGDAAFCRAARALGFDLHFVPHAVVEHPARATWSALATKARRVRGGQMAADTPLRFKWLTLAPPVVASVRFLGDVRWTLRCRLQAVAVSAALWGVQLVETGRLLLGGRAERR